MKDLLERYFQKYHRPESQTATHRPGAFPGCPDRKAPTPGHGVQRPDHPADRTGQPLRSGL